ncbi:MAG: peptidylprolyl isomerase [Euryarchaeota archaeon]|nr:peptidylprolyl isomerase [Euryarchaeota archaeon]
MPLRRALVLALALLLAPGAALPAAASEPPCTDESCEVGGGYVNATVEIDVTWNSLGGNITIMLYEEGAPVTTGNFIRLTATKFYDGCKFHRCIDDFVAQTGDPNSKNSNPYDDGWGGSGQTIPLEINGTLTHIDGAVGMARSQDPDSASSQFYICDGPQHSLDGNYAVFGLVVGGLELAKKIAACPTYGSKRPLLKDHPVDDIVMTSLTFTPGRWVNATNATAGPASGAPLLTQDVAWALGAGGAAAGATLVAIGLLRIRRRLAANRVQGPGGRVQGSDDLHALTHNPEP